MIFFKVSKLNKNNKKTKNNKEIRWIKISWTNFKHLIRDNNNNKWWWEIWIREWINNYFINNIWFNNKCICKWLDRPILFLFRCGLICRIRLWEEECLNLWEHRWVFHKWECLRVHRWLDNLILEDFNQISRLKC